MRRWLYVGVALLVAASIAGIVFAIGSVGGGRELDRVRSALRLQTNCPRIGIRRPSRTPIAKRWASSAAQSADVDCLPVGPHVIYAKFPDRLRLASAVAATLPAGGYCRLGNAIMLARLVGPATTMLSDMCQSLGGTLVLASSNLT